MVVVVVVVFFDVTFDCGAPAAIGTTNSRPIAVVASNLSIRLISISSFLVFCTPRASDTQGSMGTLWAMDSDPQRPS